MLRYLLDTQFCRRVLYERPQGLRTRFNENAEALCLSDVVLYELLYGAERSPDPPGVRREVERFAGRMTVLPFDGAAAAHAAEIRADLERQGCVIGPYDLMVVGHARSRGLVLVTSNRDEFKKVQGLRSEDWLLDSDACRIVAGPEVVATRGLS